MAKLARLLNLPPHQIANEWSTDDLSFNATLLGWAIEDEAADSDDRRVALSRRQEKKFARLDAKADGFADELEELVNG